MPAVYILYSKKLNKFYIGSCDAIEQRLLDHKNKIYVNSFTSSANDWELYFSIESLDGRRARQIERHIKSMKSKKYIENLLMYPEITERLLLKFV